MAAATTWRRVLVYDGVCNICNAGVRFVAKRDPGGRIRFSAAQSPSTQVELAKFGITAADVDKRLVYVDEHGTALRGGRAAARLGLELVQPWRAMAAVAGMLPDGVLDGAYDLVAKHRYALFGKSDVCQRPSSEAMAKHLDAQELVSASDNHVKATPLAQTPLTPEVAAALAQIMSTAPESEFDINSTPPTATGTHSRSKQTWQ